LIKTRQTKNRYLRAGQLVLVTLDSTSDAICDNCKIKIQVMVFTFNAENLVGVCLQLIFEVDPCVGLVLYFSKHRGKGSNHWTVNFKSQTFSRMGLLVGFHNFQSLFRIRSTLVANISEGVKKNLTLILKWFIFARK
jgi:hypothetical protein